MSDYVTILVSQSREASSALGRVQGSGVAVTTPALRRELQRYWAHEAARAVLAGIQGHGNAKALARVVATKNEELDALTPAEFWGMLSKTAYALNSEFDQPSAWENFRENFGSALEEAIQDLRKSIDDVVPDAPSLKKWAWGAALVGGGIALWKVFR